jgi:hypothetical protein
MDGVDRSPHTCSHCEVIQVKLPSLGEMVHRTIPRLRPKFFYFFQMDGPRVLSSSSQCSFFNWAMSGYRSVCRDEDMNLTWTLKGGIPAQDLECYPDFTIVAFIWFQHGKENHYAYLDPLSVLAAPSKSAARTADVKC